jgi:Rrf2 family transcriptional regulator, nitric oxide-sensitive transcriptional repressor
MSCITTKRNVSLAMRLTLHADYSLRVLMFAGLKGGELSTITEIAEHFEISRSHLMKVVHDLGRLGGFRLMRKPSQINVGAVVRDTEEELAVIGCLQQKGFCRIEDACILRRALQEASKAFLAVLDKYTLEDLLRPGRSLAKLLAIDWAPQALSTPRYHRRSSSRSR